MAKNYLDTFVLPNSSTYYFRDNEAIGSITRTGDSLIVANRVGTQTVIPNTDFDTINVTELNAGNLIVTGAARFLNTINGSISGQAGSVANSLTIQLNSGTTEGTNKFTYNGSSAKTVNITKSGIGLSNVENKSSATIRGEITSSNVTTALGYTPLNKAGDTMTGPLKFGDQAIPQFSGSPSYILGIEAFASGGDVKWQNVSSIKVGSATKDGNGNVIADYYVKKSGDTMSGLLTTQAGITTNASLVLQKPDDVEWSLNGNNGEPAVEMVGDSDKTFKFKFTQYGTNVDVGWDWAAVDGSGAFFRQANSPSSPGCFGFFARSSVGTAQLIGNPNGTLTWNNRRVVTSTNGSAIGSATQPIYVNSSGYVTAGTALSDGAYRAISTTVTQNDTNLITSGAVYQAIADLPEPMVFKGTLGTGGTITELPTASASNEGYTYKVITAGTYASQSAKVGDLFVCAETSSGVYSWVIIPAGDTDSDTWRNIKVDGTEKLSTAISSGLIDFTSGNHISLSFNATGNKLTVAHADTSSQASVSNSGRTYIQSITLDGDGHVTKLTSATETVVNTDTKVTQTATTTDASYEVLFSETADNTTRTEGARKSNGLTYNPSTGELTVRNDSSPGTSRISTYGVYVKDCQATPTQSNQFGYYQWGDQVQFTYRDSTNKYLGQAFAVYVTDGHTVWDKAAYHKADIYPNTTDTYSLGSSSKKWKNVYATTLYGDISNATGLTKSQVTTALGYTPPEQDTNTTYTIGISGNNVTLTPSSGDVQSITVPYATTAGSATDSTKVAKAGDTMSGTLNFTTTNAISYQGTKATYNMIKFKDNTGDAYGNGVVIGGGGLVVIGGGESADTVAAQHSSGGDEVLELASDGAVYVRTNVQNGYASAKTFTFATDGSLTATKFIGPLQGNADTATKLTSNAGSATNPVYFSGGIPVACTYSLNKTVPSDAVFTDTTYSAGDNMTLSSTTFYATKRWNAVTQGQKWSRIMFVQNTVATEGTSGLLNVTCTRANVVCNTTFLITTSHASYGQIVQLGSNNYVAFKVRICVNSSGYYYFEIYDTAQSIASGTSQTWHCSFMSFQPVTLTTYTTFTDGTTIPDGYTSNNEFTTTVGNNTVAIKNLAVTSNGTKITATRQNGSTTDMLTISNENIGSASTGTAISADDITSWSAGALPTLGTAISADDITAWDAGSTPTLGTAISADDITAWSAGTMFSASFDGKCTLSLTSGSVPSLSYTGRTIPNVTSVGSVPSLSYTARSIPNVTGVGTLPDLKYTARSIPNISVTSKSVVTGIS